jgi:hypothetical protein
MDHVASHLGEFDGTDVDGLNEQLTVIASLYDDHIVSTSNRKEQSAYLVEVLFHCPLELFLEEHDNILDITAGSHAESDRHSFSANFHVGRPGLRNQCIE